MQVYHSLTLVSDSIKLNLIPILYNVIIIIIASVPETTLSLHQQKTGWRLTNKQ